MDVGLTVIAAVVAALLHRNEVPPEAVSVDEPPTQIEESETAMLHTGGAATVTVNEQELVHPFASVTVTVYVVVTVGVTTIEAVVADVLQRNEIPPVAVNVAGSPGQSGGTTQTMAHIGAGVTVIVVVHVPLHPLALVTVTVYVVVALGFTVIDAVVAPVLQRNDVPPEAVSVDEPPTQTEESETVMLHEMGIRF